MSPSTLLFHKNGERNSAATSWYPASWRGLPIAQQPPWPDAAEVTAISDHLAELPALTTFGDARCLSAALARVSSGEAFLFQAGDCSEPFGEQAVTGVRAKHHLLTATATYLSDQIGIPVVTVGRLAGQFAKPRSAPMELVAGRMLPAFRGLMVNGPEANAEARTADPYRLLSAYYSSKLVLHELYRLSHETAGETIPAAWEPATARQVLQMRRQDKAWDGSLRAVLNEYGQTRRAANGRWSHTGLWTSHDALVLDYEEPLARQDPLTDEWFLLSTHLPWLGDRTRQVNGAHVEFLSGVANPVACKVGPAADPEDIVALCARLDPYRQRGRLTLISRMGARHVRERLPDIVTAVRRAGHPVIWACDPMHGNTIRTTSGVKTRRLTDIADDLAGFFQVLRRLGERPGGVHLEVAGAQVTECLGGTSSATEANLSHAYQSLCDPRLNNEQAMTIAETVARLITSA